jgi:hypothetical protein
VRLVLLLELYSAASSAGAAVSATAAVHAAGAAVMRQVGPAAGCAGGPGLFYGSVGLLPFSEVYAAIRSLGQVRSIISTVCTCIMADECVVVC